MKAKKVIWLASAILLTVTTTLIFSACSKNEKSGGTARVEVRLTDGPINVDAVKIDIQALEIHTSDDSTSGWHTLPLLHPGVYNLLDFRNGMDTLLGAIDLPEGRISQMRLVLGSNNSIVVNGQSYPLTTPSAQQSGLKFNIQQELTAGITYKVWIDFDASKSIVQTGNGKYNLKPVIRTFTEAISGGIKGVVLPKVSKPTVSAITGTDTLTALPDTLGRYFFKGAKAGTYILVFDADSTTGYKDQTKTGINVTLGNITVVDTVKLVK